MPRFKLTLEYDGGPYVGWQRQENGPSIQAALGEAALKFSGENVEAVGAGRTDAGVHAEGQVAHVDFVKVCDADTVKDALNYHLKPQPIAILATEEVGPDFHARFSATLRAYRYEILARRAPLALDRGRAWWVPLALDVQAMRAAAAFLVGRHDFSAFRATECQANSPVRTLDVLDVEARGERIEIRAEARSFLHHQVRNMVGSLKLVGAGKWKPEKIGELLAAGDRTLAGPTAPAEGLYLTRVGYDRG